MESFFTRHTHARWPKPGLLHVYVLPPDDAVATMASAYQDRLTERGLTNLSYQPCRWLHLSVERVNAYADELTSRQLTTLTEALREHLAVVPAFTLQIGPALVATHTVTLDAVPDQPWRALRLAVRDAAVAALGPGVVAPMTGYGRPHVTIAYSTGHVEIEPHLGALNHVRAGRASCEVTTAYLLAVEQHADAGTYTWQDIDAFALAAWDHRAPHPSTNP